MRTSTGIASGGNLGANSSRDRNHSTQISRPHPYTKSPVPSTPSPSSSSIKLPFTPPTRQSSFSSTTSNSSNHTTKNMQGQAAQLFAAQVSGMPTVPEPKKGSFVGTNHHQREEGKIPGLPGKYLSNPKTMNRLQQSQAFSPRRSSLVSSSSNNSRKNGLNESKIGESEDEDETEEDDTYTITEEDEEDEELDPRVELRIEMVTPSKSNHPSHRPKSDRKSSNSINKGKDRDCFPSSSSTSTILPINPNHLQQPPQLQQQTSSSPSPSTRIQTHASPLPALGSREKKRSDKHLAVERSAARREKREIAGVFVSAGGSGSGIGGHAAYVEDEDDDETESEEEDEGRRGVGVVNGGREAGWRKGKGKDVEHLENDKNDRQEKTKHKAQHGHQVPVIKEKVMDKRTVPNQNRLIPQHGHFAGHRSHRQSSSTTSDSDEESNELEDEPPLPPGIDPANVEDVFLDVRPVMGRLDVEEDDWSESEDEEILFAALEELTDSAQSQQAGSEASSESDSESESDDDSMHSELDSPFGPGLGEASNLPLVLMEDWTGNLVFAQPILSDGEAEMGAETASVKRKSSISRSRSRSRRGSKTTTTATTSNGDNETPVLLVDAEAINADDDDGYLDDIEDDDGDTTDSLPDEDMPSPPDILPFSIAAAGIEAQNAAFGVTTVDEAALARDLGLPLADARNLLERARAEEQQLLAGGVSSLNMGGDVIMMEVDQVNGVTMVSTPETGGEFALNSGTSSFMSDAALVSPQSAHTAPAAYPAVSTPPAQVPVNGGVPTMGSFMPSDKENGRCAVIDGTGKATPSPFLRRGGSRGRVRGGGRSAAKKRTVGDNPLSPARRPRYSSVPATSRGGLNGLRGSPLRLHRSHMLDRDDTPSDSEDMAEPISLEDVLDTSALHFQAFDVEGVDDGYNSRQLRNLRRWDRVPISTFRLSRDHHHATGTPVGLFNPDTPIQSQGFPHGPASGTVLRTSFSGPTIASTLAVDHGRFGNYLTSQSSSPILSPSPAIHQKNGDATSPRRLGKEKKKRQQYQNGSHKRARTASLGSMPALILP